MSSDSGFPAMSAYSQVESISYHLEQSAKAWEANKSDPLGEAARNYASEVNHDTQALKGILNQRFDELKQDLIRNPRHQWTWTRITQSLSQYKIAKGGSEAKGDIEFELQGKIATLLEALKKVFQETIEKALKESSNTEPSPIRVLPPRPRLRVREPSEIPPPNEENLQG